MQLKAVEVCYDHLGLAMALPIDVSFAELALLWLLLAFPTAPRRGGLARPLRQAGRA